jgi:hypothetical protein
MSRRNAYIDDLWKHVIALLGDQGEYTEWVKEHAAKVKAKCAEQTKVKLATRVTAAAPATQADSALGAVMIIE